MHWADFLVYVTYNCSYVTKWQHMKKNQNFLRIKMGEPIDTGGR